MKFILLFICILLTIHAIRYLVNSKLIKTYAYAKLKHNELFKVNKIRTTVEAIYFLLVFLSLIASLECISYANKLVENTYIALTLILHMSVGMPIFICFSKTAGFFKWHDEYLEYNLTVQTNKKNTVHIKKEDIESVEATNKELVFKLKDGQTHTISTRDFELLNSYSILKERLLGL